MEQEMSKIFNQRFCEKLKELSGRQISYEKDNVYDPLLRGEYNNFLKYCEKNKEYIMGSENLLTTVKALLKYNHRYISNLDYWNNSFSRASV